MNKKLIPYLCLIIGSLLLLCAGWCWYTPIAMWAAPVFLIRFFRSQDRWVSTLAAVPLMVLALFVNSTVGWDFVLWQALLLGLVRAVPFLVVLYADRYFCRRVPPLLAQGNRI